MNLANSESTKITGAGNVKMVVKVYYVSDLCTNSLSVPQITDRGYQIHFRKSGVLVTDREGEVIFRADRVGNLYYLKQHDLTIHEVNTVMPRSEINEWHNKLGYLNERHLKAMRGVHGLKFKSDQYAFSRNKLGLRFQ